MICRRTVVTILLPLPLLAISPKKSVKQPLPDLVVAQIEIDQYPNGISHSVRQSIPNWNYTKFDLNSDGIPDYIIRQEDPDFCGSGGCSMLIYLSNSTGYTSAYSGGNFYCKTIALTSKTNNCFDLEQKNQLKTGKISKHFLQFNGTEYKEVSGDELYYMNLSKTKLESELITIASKLKHMLLLDEAWKSKLKYNTSANDAKTEFAKYQTWALGTLRPQFEATAKISNYYVKRYGIADLRSIAINHGLTSIWQ